MPTRITSAAELADELNRLAKNLDEAADKTERTKPGDGPARGKLANEYAILAGDRLLLAAKCGAIRDRQLLAHLDVDHPLDGHTPNHSYQIARNHAFLHAVQRWLPTIAPDHRPDTHNVARQYADDLRALADAIGTKGHKDGYLGIVLDEGNRRASRNGKAADFAGNEIPWRLFCHLHRRKDSYASQQDLLRAGWTEQDIVAPETVQRHISTIRSILKPLSVAVEPKRNVGYRLAEKKSRS